MEVRLMSGDDKSKAAWDAFVATSASGTIFHKTFWLDAWGGRYDIWGLCQGGNLMGGLVVPYRPIVLQKKVSPPPFAHYSGLIFRKAVGKEVTRMSREKNISAELALLLKKNYRWGVLSFHTKVIDMQPFIWNGFDVDVAYTYILDIDDLDTTLKNMDRPRAKNIRKAEIMGLNVRACDTFDEIVPLIRKTYATQQIMFDEALMRRYEKALSARNMCRSFLCTDRNGKALAAYFLIWDEKRAYTMLAGHYEGNGNGMGGLGGPFCFWGVAQFASRELGFKELDHTGSMIPRVERFVRDFGGRMTPYFLVRWGRGVNLMTDCSKLLRRCWGA